MVNRREKVVAEAYEERGWKPVRGGWPDWLMVKTNDGLISNVVCVEVKSPSGSLRYNQAIARSVIENHFGAEYRVEVIE